MGSDVNDAKFPGIHIGWSGKYHWTNPDVILNDPESIVETKWFYTQSEMDAFFEIFDSRKANKTGPTTTNNIALLQLSDGDLVDSGQQINLIEYEIFDGETF